MRTKASNTLAGCIGCGLILGIAILLILFWVAIGALFLYAF